MIIIWRGWGITVPFIFGIVAYVVHEVIKQSLGAPYCQVHSWPIAVSVISGGIGVGLVGRWLDRQDEDMGHSLYFIRVKYWSVPAVIVGICLFFSDPASRSSRAVRAREVAPASRASVPRALPRESSRTALPKPAVAPEPVAAANSIAPATPVPASESSTPPASSGE